MRSIVSRTVATSPGSRVTWKVGRTLFTAPATFATSATAGATFAR